MAPLDLLFLDNGIMPSCVAEGGLHRGRAGNSNTIGSGRVIIDRSQNEGSTRQRMPHVKPVNVHQQHSTPSKKSNNRRVSFGRSVAIRAALHRNDFTVDEFQAVWYSAEETSRINSDAKNLVRKLNKGMPLDLQELLSVRGLECRTRRENLKRTEHRKLARNLVQEEQERQWQSGLRDPEYLALAYRTVSNQAQIEARQRGRLDELTVLV